MAKAPIAGRVKTRLCPPFSPAEAAELARAFVVDTWASASAMAASSTLLAYAGPRDRFPSQLQHAEGFEQTRGDLGERIETTANRGFEHGTVVLVIGSDLPGLPTRHLVSAADALGHADVVVGPSADGGFYLIGFRSPIRGVLSDVPWSTANAKSIVSQRVRASGRRVVETSAFNDVDDVGDVRALHARLEAGQLVAPATKLCLKGLTCVFQ